MSIDASIKENLDAYSLAIGRLALEYSELEHWMKGFANMLINSDQETGQLLTCDMPSKPLLAKLMTLYQFHFQGESRKVESFRQLVDRIDACIKKRNDTLHSSWWFVPLMAGDIPIRSQAKATVKGFTPTHVPTTPEEIYKSIEEMTQAKIELTKLSWQWILDHPRLRKLWIGAEE